MRVKLPALTVAATVLAACALSSGCASRAVIVGSEPLWPFEKLTIRIPDTATMTGYLSRPNGSPSRFVVVVQTPPCVAATKTSTVASVGTAGLLWSEFKNEATFLQFERPGARSDHPADDSPACTLRRCEGPAQQWQRIVSEAASAVRASEALVATPTVYIGIAGGALPALGAAASDENASALVLVNAALGEHHDAERLLRRLRTHLAVAILQVDRVDDVSLAEATQLFAKLQAMRQPSSMLVFEGVGGDFGLTTTESECFERAVAMLGQQVREVTDSMTSGQPRAIDCKKPDVVRDDAPVDALTIERVERL